VEGSSFCPTPGLFGDPIQMYLLQADWSFKKGLYNIFGTLADDDSSDDMLGDSVSPVEEDPDFLSYPGLSSEDSPLAQDSSFVGKLKNYCPQLYNSLSALERDHLNSILFPDQTIRENIDNDKTIIIRVCGHSFRWGLFFEVC
jgi:hypothetical protein